MNALRTALPTTSRNKVHVRKARLGERPRVVVTEDGVHDARTHTGLVVARLADVLGGGRLLAHGEHLVGVEVLEADTCGGHRSNLAHSPVIVKAQT